MSTSLLEIEDLGLTVEDDTDDRLILRGVSLSVGVGEVLSLVGESGSGKSITARAVLGMLPRGARTTGSVRFAGSSILDMSSGDLRSYRARKVAMIFQDPSAYINPVRRIGDYLTEAVTKVGNMKRATARSRAIELLEAAQIDGARQLMNRYPHELSGGMLQRVMIAGALMGEPELLLADEPTTALDVTTQAEVMAILGRFREEFNLSMLFITHDLELAAATADRTAVMYAGRIVEQQPSGILHKSPLHPYTEGLLGSRPGLGAGPERLTTIKGRPIAAAEVPGGCAFEPRCAFAKEACRQADPRLQRLASGEVACLRAEELRETGMNSHA
jgi:oligopeptide/dipeptide ABC transporter ATP-binding protein